MGLKKETGNSNGVSNRQKIHQSTSFKTNPSTNLILVWYSFPWRFQMKLLFCYYQSLFSSRPLEELVQNWELLKCLQKYLFSLVQQQGMNNVSCKHNTSIFYKWRGIIALLNVYDKYCKIFTIKLCFLVPLKTSALQDETSKLHKRPVLLCFLGHSLPLLGEHLRSKNNRTT